MQYEGELPRSFVLFSDTGVYLSHLYPFPGCPKSGVLSEALKKTELVGSEERCGLQRNWLREAKMICGSVLLAKGEALPSLLQLARAAPPDDPGVRVTGVDFPATALTLVRECGLLWRPVPLIARAHRR